MSTNSKQEPVNETVTEEAQNKTITTEEFKVSGEAVVSKVKELVREGNVRRIAIKNDEGKTLFEIPLVIGVASVIFPPTATLVALGAVGALIANLTITIEREEDKEIVVASEDA